MSDTHANPAPEADDQHGVVIQGHNYDGIQEFDNPMPGWWVWLFVITVVFSPIYVLGVHVFGFIDTYEDDLAEGQADLQMIREAHAAQNPAQTVDAAALAAYVDDPAQVAAGAETYATYCQACHGDQGQGLIGPNLTDDYWIHGATNEDVFTVITEGVVEKGMTPWEAVLTVEQRAQVMAFVQSIRGTNPPNAKAPEAEPVQSES